METSGIRIGLTHTGRMVGGCVTCGLIHLPLGSSEFCRQFKNAVTPDEQSTAYRALKAAVEMRETRG